MARLSQIFVLILSLLSFSFLEGCFAHSKVTGVQPKITRIKGRDPDPIEPINRIVFGFNDTADKLILKPVATMWKEGMPEPVQNGLTNFLRNLKTPTTFGNHLLQGQGNRAFRTLGRFVFNTTFGIGGLIDIGERMGMPYEPADFGQTLGVWGASSGPYLVLPLFGPSSVRDGIGLAADTYADPIFHYARNTDRDWINYTRFGLTALDRRARSLDITNDLEKNSLDYYAALRSVYLQNRQAFINKGKGSDNLSDPKPNGDLDYPDYENNIDYPDYEEDQSNPNSTTQDETVE